MRPLHPLFRVQLRQKQHSHWFLLADSTMFTMGKEENCILDRKCLHILALLDDYGIQAEFHFCTLHYPFLHCIVCNKPEHPDSLGLANSVRSILAKTVTKTSVLVFQHDYIIRLKIFSISSMLIYKTQQHRLLKCLQLSTATQNITFLSTLKVLGFFFSNIDNKSVSMYHS